MDSDGHWIHHKILGAGAYGIVELWKNGNTGNMLAIKKCKGGLSGLTDKQRKRWLYEVESMNSLNHPNIVQTRKIPGQLDHIGDGLPVLCMEFCNQGDLRMVLNQSENSCGIEESEALKIMRDISSAVEYLHSKKLTHRDLKPENIVLQRKKEKTIYKLTDFGYIRELGEESIDASVVGTRNYLAPEILWKPLYTCSVDYWSLGIVFYEIVTGNRPFLPNMPITETWMQLVKKKKFEDIRAWGDESGVSFSTEIEKPSSLSTCVRCELEKWFRVAFLWDPGRRGKLPLDTSDKQSPDNLIIFRLLNDILKLKIVYVFVASHYRIDSYAVNYNIRINEMQALIREKTEIDVNRQILTDQSGSLLDKPDAPLFDYLEGQQQLVLFEKDKLYIENIPKPETLSIDRMINSPRDVLNYDTIKRCYASGLFFIKRELDLYKSYIISLSIKIDLSNASFENLRENVDTLKTSANLLMNELKERSQTEIEVRESLDTIILKTQKLLDGIGKIDTNIDVLSSNFEQLKVFFDSNWLDKWTKLHEKATSLYETTLKKDPGKRESVVSMAQLIFQALEIHARQLRSKEIEAFVSDVTRFDTNIQQLEKSLNSFKALVDVYRQNFTDISTTRATPMTSIDEITFNSRSQSDRIILDNIILSKLIDELFELPDNINDFPDIDDQF